MTWLTRLSLANRLIVGLGTLAILVFGVLAGLSLKQELLPSTTVPAAIVTAAYPGSSPEIVADEVATPLEQAIGGVAGVNRVRSTSSNGFANLIVEWEYGLDNDDVVSAIRNATDAAQAQLPDETEISVMAGSTDDIPVVVLAVSSDAPLRQLGQRVHDIAVPRLADIDGVRQVQVSGEDVTQLTVTLRPAELRKHDLTAAAVTSIVQAQALVVPAGTSYSGDTELAVQVGQTPNAAKQVANWAVPTGDGPVKLGSIATVAVESVDATTVARSDGRPALSMVVLKEADADAVEISHAIADQLPGLAAALGEQSRFATVFDQATSIEQSIHDLAVEGGLGLVFAVLIILVFLLSVRSTVITAISIPLSLLVALIGLQVGDFSLNIFTLAALTVAVGRVVDDSIVVIENIKRRDTGATPLTPSALVASVREVAGAVTASTLTTVAVFLPVAIVSGVVGELFRPFAITVAVALTASLFVSMTIVPVLAYWFLHSRRRQPTGARTDTAAAAAEETRVTRLQRSYLPVLGLVLRRPVLTLVAAVLVFAGTMASATLLKTDFLGSVADKRTLQIDQKLPAGTRLSATSDATKEIERALADTDGVTGYLATVGNGGSNRATVNVTLGNEDRWDAAKAELEAVFAERPQLGEITVAAINTSGATNDVTVTITGESEQGLRSTAEEVQGLLRRTAEVTDVRSDLAEQRPLLRVTVKRTEAAGQGFTQAEVGQAIANALRGTKVGTVVLEGESRDIYVKTQGTNASPASIAQLELPVSQLQQQKASERAADRLKEKQEELAEDQQDAAKDQQAYAARQQAAAAAASRQQLEQVRQLRAAARRNLASARQELEALQQSPPPTPEPSSLAEPATGAVLAQQQWAQRVAALAAAVQQAEAAVRQFDEQLSAGEEQARQAADQREQQEEFADRQEELADRQQELADEQQELANVRAKPIRVADVAQVQSVLTPSTVTHIDGTRAVTVSATPVTRDLGALTTTLRQQLADLDNVPAGVTVELGGASQEQRDAFRQLGLAMLVAIVLVFLIMVATFRSLVQPLILLVSIPFAATGAVAGLLLTDTPLGVPAMVGLLMLIGIVVTNAIVLIDLINQYRVRGQDLHSAVVDGARLRLRPIIMTATATIFALVPMGLGLTGGGAFISRPLAVVVIGGLISSTVLTLLLVPVLYSLVERRSERKRQAGTGSSAIPAAPTHPR